MNVRYLVNKLEWNPRGQVAPQVIVTNVATKQTDKGVAPQSPFEESATTSARWPAGGCSSKYFYWLVINAG